MVARTIVLMCSLLFTLSVSAANAHAQADEFDTFLKPLIAEHCAKCHSGAKPKAKIDFKAITTSAQFLEKPALIKEMIEAIDANDMPPEDEPQLDEKQRQKLIAALKNMLREATAGKSHRQIQIRRLNRFQYNNAVKDLFKLKQDVFALSEKLMTRQDNYLHAKSGKMPDRMPDRVNVFSHALKPQGGLREVVAFPKDLRAAHGFDNQANQLTLSPLLFDAFLRISVSIVESPDFNEANVGIWNDFFKEPAADVDKSAEIKRRLEPFLMLAFRGPIDAATRDRYVAYAVAKMNQGMSFTDSMKKVASAVLSSPLFLYRSESEKDDSDAAAKQYELASRLSFFLWASGPDMELLQLAQRGELAKPDVLNKTIDRMLADPKIERFLDSFPSQWMQLENVLAATPDPKLSRLFSLDKDRPASVQMVLEPLLLFDAVFVEDRPIVDLIAPTFSYRSEFLRDWYTTDLKPPQMDNTKIVAENRANDERRNALQSALKKAKAERDALLQPVRAALLAARQADTTKKPVDLKPIAAWEFDGDLKDAIGSLDLKPHGKTEFKDRMVVLNKSYLLSAPLTADLKAKTLEVWCKVPNLDQAGGGVMGIQGPGDFFDTIVIGERQARHWISGSNGFSRTDDFPESTPETKVNDMVHLVMVYAADGTTTLYRDGVPYGKPYRKGAATFPKGSSSVIFGLRHLPAGGNKFLSVSIDRARLYDRALTADEVAASSSGNNLYVSEKDVIAALKPEQRTQFETLTKSLARDEADLKRVPPRQDPNKAQQIANKRFDDGIRSKLRSPMFERVPATDPRFGGVITNAAMLSMTSGPKRTHPIARGAWIIEVIFNDPPPPPPNDVPPLNEAQGAKNLTIREKFAVHRENPTCAGCHSRLDPLGFAMESYDITGRWRDKYDNGRDVDAGGTLMKKYPFKNAIDFKQVLVKEQKRFAKAFAGHLLRFALARELEAADTLTQDHIVQKAEAKQFKLKAMIREVILSDAFSGVPKKANGTDSSR